MLPLSDFIFQLLECVYRQITNNMAVAAEQCDMAGKLSVRLPGPKRRDCLETKKLNSSIPPGVPEDWEYRKMPP